MDENITFHVVAMPFEVPSSGSFSAYLVVDNWDDWFEFSTTYRLTVFDGDATRHDMGYVKIGQFRMKKGDRRPAIPETFERLDEQFFSVGQDKSYYQTLNALPDTLKEQILHGLRDVVRDQALFVRALGERVTTISLLRSVSPATVRGQFRRILLGGAVLSEYEFKYIAPRGLIRRQMPPVQLDFAVLPDSHPPTNIHVLIGRNGVGKTYILNRMTSALLEPNALAARVGEFVFETDDDTGVFANLVSVTFSAFDPFRALPPKKDRGEGVQYFYIGLKRPSRTREGAGIPKSLNRLADEFVASVAVCSRGVKLTRWRRCLAILEADPIFKSADVLALSDAPAADQKQAAKKLFNKLSAGHKIVLLTITRLVETVEEKTLVLLDEPEAHLHPPLLSAFVRVLSDLLSDRNGVAIVATHSPVVLQEVPKTCVWKLRRIGDLSQVERPQIETFGENVGTLTREVFGLEVTHSGFHKMLEDAIAEERNLESVFAYFGEQLGGEARAIARARIASGDSSEG